MLSKKSILIYIDEPNWVFDFMAKSLIYEFSYKYDFYFDYCCFHKYLKKDQSIYNRFLRDIKTWFYNIYYLISLKYSLVDYSFYSILPFQITPFFQVNKYYKGQVIRRRVKPSFLSYDAIIYLDFYYEHFSKISKKSKIKIKGIFTDGFPPNGTSGDILFLRQNGNEFCPTSFNVFFSRYFNNIDILLCGSNLILKRYESFHGKKFFVNFFYKEEIFNQKGVKRLGNKLTIGWTGNPKREFKNFYSVIVPAIEKLKDQGYDIDFRTRFHGSYFDLPNFYEGIDIVVVASSGDAGPSMFAEASLCGVPSVSTKIGFAEMVLIDGVNGLFFDGSIDDLTEKIKQIYNSPDLLKMFNSRIRKDYLNTMSNQILFDKWKLVLEEI